jgi:SAM-dependent methyltransferase
MTPAVDFSRRSSSSELMDGDATDFETFRDCLVDLAKVNTLTLAYRPTLRFFDGLAAAGLLPRDRAVTILDAGSGYGDTLRKVSRWAERRGIAVALTGVDLNPWSTRAAEAATPRERGIGFVTGSVLDYRSACDIIISSLFAHHLDDATLVRFVAQMEGQARIAWFINDLHRHPIPYHCFAVLSRALAFHYFVQHDGPISIARAFRADDWRAILARAGVPPGAAKLRWWFPFRLCVARVRP